VKFKPPLEKKKMPGYTGLGHLMHRYIEYGETVPLPVVNKTPKEIQEARKKKNAEQAELRIKLHKVKWDPKNDPNMTGDAYKTLFVGRLAFDVGEDDLKHEFEYYGNVTQVLLAKDKKGKSRGFAFVEFESSQDLKEAYNDADGRKITGRRIVVDVERGRTVKNWIPRRLGGGLGGTRLGGKKVNTRHSGRNPPPGSRRGDRGRSGKDRDRKSDRGDRDRDKKRSRRDRSRGRDRDKDRDRDRDRKRRRE